MWQIYEFRFIVFVVDMYDLIGVLDAFIFYKEKI